MADLDGKPEGDNACQESDGRAQAYGTVRYGTRVTWLKLDCLNPDLQQARMSARRKRRLKPVPHPAPASLRAYRNGTPAARLRHVIRSGSGLSQAAGYRFVRLSDELR